MDEKETSPESIKIVESTIEERRKRYQDIAEQKNAKKAISIIACIPAYNEEQSIGSVVMRTERYVDQVFVCDDGSTDLTGEIAQKIGAVVIKHETNLGKGAASKCALTYALELEPDYLVILDGDGKHNPDEIPILVESLLAEEADIVIGSRYMEGNSSDVPLYRKIWLKIIDLVFKGTVNRNVSDNQSGFRVFTREALMQIIETNSDGFRFNVEQIQVATQKGLKIIEAPVNVNYSKLDRNIRKTPSRHVTRKLGDVLRLVLNKRPLKLLGLPGLVSVGIGILSTMLFLFRFFSSGYVSVPLALISNVTILLGTLLFLSGLILYAINEMGPRL